MARKIVPITILTGYLGAGKTTLLNYILNNQQGYKVAVIVNDIGEVNVDEGLIEKGGNITEKDSVVPLTNGCICCTLKTDLLEQIGALLKQQKFDYILIEASGICEPIPIAQTISLIDGTINDPEMRLPKVCRLDGIVSVVDAARLIDEFDAGNALLDEDLDEEDIASLLIQQIEFCTTILINKIDLITPEQRELVKAVIRKLQPEAKLIETEYCRVDLADVLDTKAFDFEKAYRSAGWIKELERADEEEEAEGESEEYGIGTFVYYRRRPFDQAKFDDFAQDWPAGVIRCKGMLWFAGERDRAYVFEQAGRQLTAYDQGMWVAAAPKKQRDKLLAEDADLRDIWDEKYGDRGIKLVFIGHEMDRDAIIAALDACLGE